MQMKSNYTFQLKCGYGWPYGPQEAKLSIIWPFTENVVDHCFILKKTYYNYKASKCHESLFSTHHCIKICEEKTRTNEI